MRVVGYVRVSTDRQAEDGLGLDIQERAIATWAHANGHEVVAVARDEGISGSNGIESRIGLAEALDALRSGEAGVLVVYRLDRLARDLVLQEQLFAEIRRMDRLLFSTSPSESQYLSDDPADPSRALIRQVLGAVSEYERKMIALRLRAGRKRKAELGGFIGGNAPYGYRSEAGALALDEAEQQTIQRIVDLHRSGYSTRLIAATLTGEGRNPRRATQWHPWTVSGILNRSISI